MDGGSFVGNVYSIKFGNSIRHGKHTASGACPDSRSCNAGRNSGGGGSISTGWRSGSISNSGNGFTCWLTGPPPATARVLECMPAFLVQGAALPIITAKQLQLGQLMHRSSSTMVVLDQVYGIHAAIKFYRQDDGQQMIREAQSYCCVFPLWGDTVPSLLLVGPSPDWGCPFMAVEYVEGFTLDWLRCHKGPINWELQASRRGIAQCSRNVGCCITTSALALSSAARSSQLQVPFPAAVSRW